MTVKILYPTRIMDWKNPLAPSPMLELMNTQSGAIAYLTASNIGFLSSAFLNRFADYMSHVPPSDELLDTGDFNRITIKISDETATNNIACKLEEIIAEWLQYSEVPNNRGARIAIMSNVDTIQNASGKTYIWDVAFSSFIVYSFRRAVMNFPATQDQANTDMSNLYKKISAVKADLVMTINKQE